MHGEDQEDGHKACDCECHHLVGPMKMEFKLAMLEKKEKMLHAKLDFIGKMKEMVKKMPTEQK